MHVRVKDLPNVLQAALHVVGYAKSDIALESRSEVSVADSGGQGRRSFVVLVDLATGRNESHYGSWGGANIFNPSNAVDLDTTDRVVHPGMAVIKGSEGYGTTAATIYLHPDNIVPVLPTPAVSERDRTILGTFGYISSYRQEQWREMKVTTEELDSLAARGFIKRNKAGAVSITTEGKNVKGRVL